MQRAESWAFQAESSEEDLGKDPRSSDEDALSSGADDDASEDEESITSHEFGIQEAEDEEFETSSEGEMMENVFCEGQKLAEGSRRSRSPKLTVSVITFK